MTENTLARKRSANALVLLFTLIAHFLAYTYWRSMINRPLSGGETSSTLSIKLIMSEADTQRLAEDRPRPPNEAPKLPSVKTKIDASRPVTPQAITITSDVIVPPIDDDAAPAADTTAGISTDQMIANAKRDVGKIDRDLRKASPKFPDPAPKSVQARLEKNIAAAGKHAWGESQQKVMSDGTRITKYYGPTGAYCVTNAGPGSTNGMDQIQGGVRSKVTNCGSLFD